MTAAKPTGITTLCRSCGAEVWWAHTTGGRAMRYQAHFVTCPNADEWRKR